MANSLYKIYIYNIYISPPSQANTISLMVDSEAAEGCVHLVLLPEDREKLINNFVLEPSKRPIRVDNNSWLSHLNPAPPQSTEGVFIKLVYESVSGRNCRIRD